MHGPSRTCPRSSWSFCEERLQNRNLLLTLNTDQLNGLSEHAECVLLSPLAMLDGVSVLPLPLERPSVLGVLETLRPGGPPGVVLL